MPNQTIDYEQNHRIELASSKVNAAGEFEILAITAGDGNGWSFSTDALKASLTLWDGAQTFIDHHWYGHSVHDLAGVCYAPKWDEAAQGIKLSLRPIGPSAPVLAELGKQMLAEGEKPKIGFSADLVFTANGKDVETILKIFSVDLVVNPARGGEFIREIYQKLNLYREGVNMPKELPVLTDAQQTTLPGVEHVQNQISTDKKEVEKLVSVQQHLAQLNDEAEKVRDMRIKMGEQFLDSALAAAKLPAPVVERLRKQFAGSLFEAQQLTDAIEDAREMVSQLTGGAAVSGPRIHSVFDTADKLQAAADDLLGAPREAVAKDLKVAKLSGIRELISCSPVTMTCTVALTPNACSLPLRPISPALSRTRSIRSLSTPGNSLELPAMTGGRALRASSISTISTPSPVRWWERLARCQPSAKVQNTPSWWSVILPKLPTLPSTAATSRSRSS